jgi:predicted alpha/beta superfamily hydrolase
MKQQISFPPLFALFFCIAFTPAAFAQGLDNDKQAVATQFQDAFDKKEQATIKVFSSTDAVDPNIPIMEQQITPTILHNEKNITVRLPEGYETSNKKYTVLYFLYGLAAEVDEIASICKTMHQTKGTEKMIVVGVDLSEEKLSRMTDSENYDAFLSYIAKELKPDIGNKYRTNGRSILYEKSFSGSLALYTLLTQPKLFNGYIAASKQWYENDNSYFTGLANKVLKKSKPFKGRKIFLATLNGAYNNNNIPEVDRQMKQFSQMLMAKSKKKILAKYQAFDDWNITPQPGFTEGLLFVSKKR